MITCDIAVLEEAKPTLPSASTNSNHPIQSTRPSETPLLDWIAQELREADGLDHASAMRAAKRLLNEAYAAVTFGAMQNTHKEILT